MSASPDQGSPSRIFLSSGSFPTRRDGSSSSSPRSAARPDPGLGHARGEPGTGAGTATGGAASIDGPGSRGTGFPVTNRNKRSITLDVRSPRGREVFRKCGYLDYVDGRRPTDDRPQRRATCTNAPLNLGAAVPGTDGASSVEFCVTPLPVRGVTAVLVTAEDRSTLIAAEAQVGPAADAARSADTELRLLQDLAQLLGRVLVQDQLADVMQDDAGKHEIFIRVVSARYMACYISHLHDVLEHTGAVGVVNLLRGWPLS